MSNESNQVGSVVLARLEDQDGHVQLVDPDDSIRIEMNSPFTDLAEARPLEDDSIWCLEWRQGHLLFAAFTVPSGRSLSLTGRFHAAPTDAIFDFSFSVTSSGVVATHPRKEVMVVLSDASAELFTTEVASTDGQVCVRATYAGALS